MLKYNLELALFDDIGKIHDQLGMIRSVIAKLANCARRIMHPVYLSFMFSNIDSVSDGAPVATSPMRFRNSKWGVKQYFFLFYPSMQIVQPG